VLDVMRRHAHALVEVKGDEHAAMRDFRKHVGWYLTGYPVGGAARRELALSSTLVDLECQLDALDPDTELPPGSERFARGHTQGPRKVTLPQHWRETREDPTPPLGADLAVSGG
jgi:hypothetical protein